MTVTSRTSAVTPINYNYSSLNTVYLQIVQPIILKHLSCVAGLEIFFLLDFLSYFSLPYLTSWLFNTY